MTLEVVILWKHVHNPILSLKPRKETVDAWNLLGFKTTILVTYIACILFI